MDEQDLWLAGRLVQATRDAADQAMLDGNTPGAEYLDTTANAIEVGVELGG